MDSSPAPDPMALRALCETLKSTAKTVSERILRRWRSIGESEPWHALPDDLDFDHLPMLVRGLANESALHGLNRRTLEDEGKWPSVLDELLESWPLP